MLFHSIINNDYAWELSLFSKYRDFSDGISFLETNISWDKYLSDHTPQFIFLIVLCNYKLIEFNIYYRWHRDDYI